MAYNEHFKGEDPSVTKFNGDRTILTSCAYLLPYIKSDMMILDVGCGPKTITAGLSEIVADGKVIGVDVTDPIIERARSTFPSSEFPNLDFAVGDAPNLSEFKDNSFDDVHAHQIFAHLTDLVKALKEFYRICKLVGLLLAERVMDVASYRNGDHIDAGARLEEWAQKVGFNEYGGKIVLNMGELRFPSHLQGMEGENAEHAIKAGIATRDQMNVWREAWEELDRTEGNEFVLETGELLCWKGPL